MYLQILYKYICVLKITNITFPVFFFRGGGQKKGMVRIKGTKELHNWH